MNSIDLANRHAIVTGGAQGIGLAIARRFLSSGASVTLWDRDGDLLASAVRELSGLGAVDAATVDVTEAASVDAAAASTAEKFGRIDILVANAGISGPNLKCWEYPVEVWKQIVDVDLTGVFLCCRAVVPFMLQRKYGRIVNVASIAGKEGNPNASAYSAAKAGVIALTKSLGKELAGLNIAVNCITPAAAPHPNFRTDIAGAHRLHAVEDSAGDAFLMSKKSRPWWRGWYRKRTLLPPERYLI